MINAKEAKQRFLNGIMLWWLSMGGNQIDTVLTTDLTCEIKGDVYGFITEFDRTKAEILKTIKEAKNKFDYIYVATNDSSKRRELIKFIPKYIGIVGQSDDYRFGMVNSVIRAAERIR